MLGKHPCCAPDLLPLHLECREQFLLCFTPTCGGCMGGKCKAWEMQESCGEMLWVRSLASPQIRPQQLGCSVPVPKELTASSWVTRAVAKEGSEG